jgi:hypothetical protein
VRLSSLIVASGTLGLVLGDRCTSTSDLLALVLGLLHGLTGSFLLLRNSVTDQSVFGLKLSHRILVIVNQAESSGLAATKLGSETKQDSQLGISLVHASYNFLKLLFWHIRPTRVNDIHDHLLREKAKEREIHCEQDGIYKLDMICGAQCVACPFFYREENAKRHAKATSGSDILPALDVPSTRRADGM